MLGGFILALPFVLIQLICLSHQVWKKLNGFGCLKHSIGDPAFLWRCCIRLFCDASPALPFLVEFQDREVLPKWRDYVSFCNKPPILDWNQF